MINDTIILNDRDRLASPQPAGRRIAGVVLLGGSVRPTRFHTAVGRSSVDLPYAPGRTLMDAWCDQVTAVATARVGQIPLRVLTDQVATAPGFNHSPASALVQVDRDPSAWRGTGGVLRDISGAYRPDDLLLVANAAQVLLRPLTELVARLDALGADVAVLAHDDGTPSTLMLVRCGCLSTLPEIGFVDMKEQAIPLLAARHSVKVVCLPTAATLGLRTAQTYLAGLRALHAPSQGADGEQWRSAFSIIEEGASIEPGVRLHDSVVLHGGAVARGAVLVRSLVCSGGRVERNAVVVDKLVWAQGMEPTEEEAA